MGPLLLYVIVGVPYTTDVIFFEQPSDWFTKVWYVFLCLSEICLIFSEIQKEN